IRFLLRLPSQRLTWINYQLAPYETACLGGNHRRLVHAAVVSLIEKGAVNITESVAALGLIRSQKFCFNGAITDLTEPIEKFVAQKILDLDGKIKAVLSLNLPESITNPIQQKLEQYGLVVTKDQALKAQIYPVIMFTTVFTIGLIRLIIGISNHKPVNYLIMCLLGFFVLGITLFTKPHRSRYGDKFLLDLSIKERANLLNPDGNNPSNLLLAFALFGPIAISRESAFAELYQVLSPPSNSSDSSSSDGGSSGCGGGGGCGGCGGGGD
ncbi:MAG: TIGR04222 domain-containing membrane protein, partial [Pseudanabaena sp. ELA607]